MASSYRDDSYRRPNFATDGAMPGYFSRPRLPPIPPMPIFPTPTQPPPWAEPPRVPTPFPAPLPVPPHDVDPSDRNPYNDPDWSPFLITESQRAGIADAPQGGMLERLLAVLAEPAGSASDVYGTGSEGGPRMAEVDAAAPREADDDQDPIRILARRVVRY